MVRHRILGFWVAAILGLPTAPTTAAKNDCIVPTPT
jgi:hypothetical protein